MAFPLFLEPRGNTEAARQLKALCLPAAHPQRRATRQHSTPDSDFARGRSARSMRESTPARMPASAESISESIGSLSIQSQHDVVRFVLPPLPPHRLCRSSEQFSTVETWQRDSVSGPAGPSGAAASSC